MPVFAILMLFAVGLFAPSAGLAAGAAKPASPVARKGKVTQLPNGLIIEDVVIGKGATARVGSLVSVEYTGRFPNGPEFDSSRRAGRPYRLRLGAREVIDGWDIGIQGMRVGGKRRLTVPPGLAYGATGYGGVIPPNATLLFDLELVDATRPTPPR